MFICRRMLYLCYYVDINVIHVPRDGQKRAGFRQRPSCAIHTRTDMFIFTILQRKWTLKFDIRSPDVFDLCRQSPIWNAYKILFVPI